MEEDNKMNEINEVNEINERTKDSVIDVDSYSNMKEEKVEQYRLTIDLIMIVGKYLETVQDFVQLIRLCKKFRELPEMYKMNPISNCDIFPNIETQHFYNPSDALYSRRDMYKYVYWRPNKALLSLIDMEDDSIIVKRTELNRNEIKATIRTTVPEGIWRVANRAFEDKQITYVKLPKTLKELGDSSFASTSIENINIPNGVTSLGNYCFNRCYQLTRIKLPSTLKRIGNNCFNKTKLKEIVIPEGVTELNDGCFSNIFGCVEDIYLPNSLTKIDDSTFQNTKITKIHASKKVKPLVERLHFEKKPKITGYSKLKFNSGRI